MTKSIEYKKRFLATVLIALVLIAVLCGRSFAQDNRAVSNLGFCHPRYDYNGFLSQFQNATSIKTRIIWNTFNPNGCPNLERLVKENRKILLDIHIANGPGQRNGRSQPYEIFHGYNPAQLEAALIRKEPQILNRFRVELTKIKAIIERRGPAAPLMQVRISPCLECNVGKAARQVMLDLAAQYLPGRELIDNPYTDSTCIAPYLCEKHGSKGKGNIVDLDGEDADRVDMLDFGRRNAGINTVSSWKLCNNGFKKDESWKPPLQRTNFCGERDNRDFAYWASPYALTVGSAVQEDDKRGCRKFLNPRDGASKNFTLKLGDGRSYAVLLLHASFNKLAVRRVEITKNGKVFDTAKYRGRYSHDKPASNRQIWDFRKHPATYPDNAVLHVDSSCYVLDKPQFRID